MAHAGWLRSIRRWVFVVAVAGLSGGLAPSPSQAAGLRLTPPTHLDPLDQPAGPLDLKAVSFGQVDTQLQLRIRTYGEWHPRTLGTEADGGRSLCVRVEGPQARGDVCIDTAEGAVVLRWRADPPGGSDPGAGSGSSSGAGSGAGSGDTGGWTTLEALVGRPDDQTLLASFPPSELGLAPSAFSWSVESRWSGTTACPATAPCLDRAPDQGAFGARSAVLVQPRCFGAASRDPLHPCSNPALRTLVTPTPFEATITPNAYCRPLPEQGLAHPCTFGRPDAPGRDQVLLAGDSHASHWRGALEVVAQAEGWHGISITHSSCPFTAHPTNQDAARNRTCARFFAATRRWLMAHPEVHTVYTSSHKLEDTSARRRDYQRTWASLPSSVTRIYVIRDTPGIAYPQAGCVTRMIARHQPAGNACSQPRSSNLLPDPNAAAARTSAQSRVRLLDLTRFFCGPTRCLAVVGGVLVRKDGDHMTSAFATTLGPYLMRAAHAG